MIMMMVISLAVVMAIALIRVVALAVVVTGRSQRPPSGEGRVLDVESRVGVSAFGASASLHEALLEVIRQEGV